MRIFINNKMDEKFFLPTVLELQTSLEGYNFILPF